MKIQLEKSWLGHPAGRVLDVGGGVAQLLIQRKIAVIVKADGQVDSTKTDSKSDGKSGVQSETRLFTHRSQRNGAIKTA